MANGQSHVEAWRGLLDDGQDHRVLELVVDALDSVEARGADRYEDVKRRLFWVLSTMVGILGALIAIAIRI